MSTKLHTHSVKDLHTPILGDGWSDDKQMSADLNCFKNGTITYSGGSKSVISFSDAKSFKEVEKTLNVDVDVDINVAVWSGDFGASYARDVKDTSYSSAFYFIEKVILPVASFQPAGFGTDALNEIGQGEYKMGPQQFRSVCGNKLVTQSQLGAQLLVTLKVNFESHYDKITFDTHGNGKFAGGIVSVKASIGYVATTYHIGGDLEFSAYQSGGDASQLAKIFSKCGPHYCVTSCSLSNLDACDGVIDGVLDYAANNFPDQIGFVNGTVTGSAVPVDSVMIDVTELGLNPGNTAANATVVAARKELGDIYFAQQRNHTFVDHIVESSYVQYFPPDTSAMFKAIDNALEANLDILNDPDTGAIGCYLHPDQCPTIRDTIMRQLKPINTEYLDQMNKGISLIGNEAYAEYVGECGGAHQWRCYKISLSVVSNLFPGDNSTIYLNEAKPGVVNYVSLVNDTLSVVAGGVACLPANKADSHYEKYSFAPCDKYVESANCLAALGATTSEAQINCRNHLYNTCEGCVAPIGEIVFELLDYNPL